jgi:hypothetical protein
LDINPQYIDPHKEQLLEAKLDASSSRDIKFFPSEKKKSDPKPIISTKNEDNMDNKDNRDVKDDTASETSTSYQKRRYKDIRENNLKDHESNFSRRPVPPRHKKYDNNDAKPNKYDAKPDNNDAKLNNNDAKPNNNHAKPDNNDAKIDKDNVDKDKDNVKVDKYDPKYDDKTPKYDIDKDNERVERYDERVERYDERVKRYDERVDADEKSDEDIKTAKSSKIMIKMDTNDKKQPDSLIRRESRDQSRIDNKSRVDDNKSRVDDNKSRIDDNKSRVDDNKSRVDDHKSRIDDNKSRVDDNKSRVDDNKSRVDDNKSRVDDNKSRVVDDKKSRVDDKKSTVVFPWVSKAVPLRKPRKSNGKLAKMDINDDKGEYEYVNDSELTVESAFERKSKAYNTFPVFEDYDHHSCMPNITDRTIPVDTFIENLISYLSDGDNRSEMSFESNDSTVRTHLTEKVRRFIDMDN